MPINSGYTDFSEYTTNANLSGEDWTRANHSATTEWIVNEDVNVPGGKLVQTTYTDGGPQNFILTWDTLPSAENWEITFLGRQENANDHNWGVAARFLDLTDEAYTGLLRNGGIDNRIAYTDGVGTILNSLEVGAHGIDVTDWFWTRFRVNGNTLSIRSWQQGTTEPTTWVVNITNDDVSGAGNAGLFFRNSASTWVQWAYFGWAIDGETAPTSDDPVSPPAGNVTGIGSVESTGSKQTTHDTNITGIGSVETTTSMIPPTPINLQGTPSMNSILWTWEDGVPAAEEEYGYTDFSEYSTSGYIQQNADWELLDPSTSSPFLIKEIEGVIGGKVLERTAPDGASAANAMVYYTPMPDAEDMEVVVLCRNQTAGEHNWGVGVRADSGEGTKCYTSGLRNNTDDSRFGFVDGIHSSLTSLAIGDRGGIDSTNWFWNRTRIEGNTLYIKLWQDGDPEPSEWTLTYTDTDNNVTSAGKAGLFMRQSTHDDYCQWAYFGWATNGATAPLPE